ncbi:MAG: O-antigen ligase family protein [Vibrio ordalii]|uniref:O-antigen ligase family protein n=1 Tax=Vibrio ordalii TaxID=28174 RepID=UPI003F30D1C3
MQLRANVFEIPVVSFFFLSIFTSKSGIYIGLVLLSILSLYLLYTEKNLLKNLKKLPVFFIFLFGLGIIITLPYHGDINDFLLYLRKGCIFIIVPVLVCILQRKHNLKYAVLSIAGGLLIALAYATLKLLTTTAYEQPPLRLDSFWDVGRWSEMLAYCIAILLPISFESNKNDRFRIFSILLLILSVVFLLLSGSRGPLLAVLITASFYFLLRSPKVILGVIMICAPLFYFGNNISQIENISNRVISISDLNTDDSNKARLAMWEQGVKFSYYNLLEQPQYFFFGVGIKQFRSSYTQFLNETTDISTILEETNNQFSLNDLHNTYLDLMVKLGVIYGLSYIGLLFFVFYQFWQYTKNSPPWAYAGICLIATYAINAMFYTSGLEYQTTVFFTLIALCYAKLHSNTNEGVTTNV